MHLNLSGAEKITDYLGKILSGEFGLADHRSDEKLTKLWDGKIDFYNTMREDQERELREYGYLKSYGAVAQEVGSDE